MLPERFVNVELARLRHGRRVDRLGPLLLEGDVLADGAVAALTAMPSRRREVLLQRLFAGEAPRETPEAVVRLFEQLRHVPFWVDEARCARGGQAFLRTGLLGGFVLAFRSLIRGYCSPAGNKPLVYSGRLTAHAPRRLAETSRFVEAVSGEGGLRVGAPGYVAAGRVRLMHAQVRRLLRASPRWNARAWGVPINQVDMAGTVQLFSLVVVEGLRKMGVALSSEEAEDLLHLWRYAGYLLGVREELLTATEREAHALWDAITATEAPPDADSAALAHALLGLPVAQARSEEERARAERFSDFSYGLSRYLLGDGLADALGYPRTRWSLVAPLLRPLLSGASQLLRKLPGVDALALDAGVAYWRQAVSRGLGHQDATFEMPHAVPGA